MGNCTPCSDSVFLVLNLASNPPRSDPSTMQSGDVKSTATQFVTGADEKFYMAKLAEQAERYEDMAAFMEAGVKMLDSTGLTTENRNLLSVAFKNVIGSRRSSWRVYTSLSDKHEKYKLDSCIKAVEEELRQNCGKVIEILNNLISRVEDSIPSDDSGSDPINKESLESLVFYLKMKGDYFRYQAEIINLPKQESQEEPECVTQAKEAYSKADEKANNLPCIHPVRLGLALNYSVFYYEVKNDPGTACKIAKEAFDDAIASLAEAQEEGPFKDSTLIMQLLRDNLTLWTAESDDNEENPDDN